MKVILVFLLITICYTDEYRKIKLEDITLDSYVPVKIGQKVIIEIEGNPTTGFIWILSNPEHLRKVKTLNLDDKNSAEYFTRTESDGKLGSKGVYHFKFEAKEMGNDVLIFKNIRPWNKEVSSTKSINIIVVTPDL